MAQNRADESGRAWTRLESVNVSIAGRSAPSARQWLWTGWVRPHSGHTRNAWRIKPGGARARRVDGRAMRVAGRRYSRYRARMSDAEVEVVRRAAIKLVTPLAHAAPEVLAAALRPRDDDYAAVFVGDAAARAREAYLALWRAPPASLAGPGQTVVTAVACRAGELATHNPHSLQLPGGYRRIAHELRPELIWVRFGFHAPGESAGRSHDGLVWRTGRWAWFPKPWRVLGIDVN